MYLLQHAPATESLAGIRAALREDDADILAWAWETLYLLTNSQTGGQWVMKCPVSDLIAVLREVPARAPRAWDLYWVLMCRSNDRVPIAEVILPRLTRLSDATILGDMLRQCAISMLSVDNQRAAARECLRIGLTNPEPKIRECFLKELLSLGETDLPEDFPARQAAAAQVGRLERLCSLLAQRQSPLLEGVVSDHLQAGCEGSRGLAIDLLGFLDKGLGRKTSRKVASDALEATEPRVREAARQWLETRPEK